MVEAAEWVKPASPRVGGFRELESPQSADSITVQFADFTHMPSGFTHHAIGVPASVRMVTIQIPLSDPAPQTYVAQQRGHIDVRLDRQTQLPAFRQIHAGLRAANATLPNDKPDESAADVIRYLAALVASEMENGDVNDWPQCLQDSAPRRWAESVGSLRAGMGERKPGSPEAARLFVFDQAVSVFLH